MKKIALIVAVICALCATSAKADNWTITLVAGTSNENFTWASASTDSLTIKLPKGGIIYVAGGTKRTIPPGPTKIASLTYNDGGSGGGGGGHDYLHHFDHQQMGGSGGNGPLVFNFTNTQTGITSTFVCNVPGYSGNVNFSGNSVWTYSTSTVFSVPVTPASDYCPYSHFSLFGKELVFAQ